MSKCQCSMTISMTGDGCRYCQPQEYIDRVSECLQENREEASSLEAERDQLKAENEAYKKLHDWFKAENERLAKINHDHVVKNNTLTIQSARNEEQITALRTALDEARELLSEPEGDTSPEWADEWRNKRDAWLEANKQRP